MRLIALLISFLFLYTLVTSGGSDGFTLVRKGKHAELARTVAKAGAFEYGKDMVRGVNLGALSPPLIIVGFF